MIGLGVGGAGGGGAGVVGAENIGGSGVSAMTSVPPASCELLTLHAVP